MWRVTGMFAALVASTALLSGCSEPELGSGEATLIIVTQTTSDGMFYTAGAVQEYELFLGDQKMQPELDPNGLAIFRNLPEDEDYRIVAAQRPCQYTCANGLGDRRDECSLDLTISATTTAYAAAWEALKPCTFTKIDPDDI